MKKTKLNKLGKTDRSKLEKKMDKLCSEIVRMQEPACVQCGSIEKLSAGHLFSRRKKSLRWDIGPVGNVHTQCWPCNFRHTIDQWPYWNWYINKYGLDQFNILRAEYDRVNPIKTYQMEGIYEVLKEVFESLTKSEKGELPF